MANPEHVEILKQGVEAWNKWRDSNPEVWPDLVGANLRNLDLSGINFFTTDLREADLANCDLRNAHLAGSILILANLANADLSHADLYIANLNGAMLTGADLAFVSIGLTILTNNDLRGVCHLETIRHRDQSHIGIDTIYRSKGDIPESFLRNCGVTESFIAQIPALVAALEPIQFYSCFISYSSKDEGVAERLHADLQSKGVRCWFAPEDLKIGDRFRDRIDESIRLHDKLLIVLSENSVASEWVGDEVESAIEREHREGRTVLFPIKIDDAVMESTQAWAASIRRTRHIGDFTRWKDHDSYTKAFDRLLRNLKAEEKA